MESVAKTNYNHKTMADAVLKDPENIEKIQRIHKNIISKKFTPQQAKFGARKYAIMLCQSSNIYTCEKNNCDFCIGYEDILPIIEN